MNGTDSPTFNLVRKAWVPVIYLDGAAREVSLSQLFADAPRIRQIAGDIPQQTLPMLRLCEAIMYRAYGRAFPEPPAQPDMLAFWRALWDNGAFDELVEEYLTEFEPAFDLFGEKPFYQVPGLTYASKDKDFDPIGEIIADVPKPGKFLFSMRSLNAPTSLAFPEAARWLLFFQAYDCAGIKTPVEGNTHVNKGKVYPPKGFFGTGWLGSIGGVFLEGSNLFETLMLNWVLYDSAEPGKALFGNPNDLPPWERPSPGCDYVVRNPVGPVGMDTWQCRRARLVTDDADRRVVGIVSCYGDVVRPTQTPGFETMTAWRESPQQQKALGTPFVPLMPKAHDCSKAFWRGLASIVARAPGADLRPGVLRWVETLRASGARGLSGSVPVHAQGVEYGSQSSVIANTFDDCIDLGSAMLRGDSPAAAAAVEVVAQADNAVFQLVVLARSVEQAAGDKRIGGAETRFSDDVREHAYADLDGLFRSRIAGFDEAQPVEGYCQAWAADVHRTLLRLGEACVSQSGVSPFQRRATGSVAEAASKFRRQLDKILGPLSAPEGKE